MNSNLKPSLYMLSCSVLWSLSCALVSFIPWNPLVISGWRSALACVVLGLNFYHSRFRVKLCKKSLLGAVSILLMCSFYISATKLTSAENAIALQFTSPFFILLLEALLYKKRILPADLIAVLCTMSGVAILFFEGFSKSQLLGNLCAVAAGFFSACMYVVLGDDDPQLRGSSVLLGHLFCALACIPFTALYPPDISYVSLFCIIILGVFQLGLPYIFLLKAASGCSPLSCSLISAVEPMLAPLWVFFLTGESPDCRAFIGCSVIILSVSLRNIYCALSPERRAK